ncbi:MAG: hypothetical protein EBS70_04445 [Actinobacteria bacterium]|nr:hypothetical protein [Actinomycetota bacterium]
MRALKVLVSAAIVASVAAIASPSSAVVSWEFSQDSVSLGLTGVSPHVERVGSNDRLWYPGGPEGTVASDCTDAGTCTKLTLGGRLGNDFTAITLSNGTRRAYFVEMSPNAGTKTVVSAACVTNECLGVGVSTPIASDVAVSNNEKAWGVPDAVVLPDGRVRVYFVVSPVMTNSCPEKVVSYISSDGISFTKESGYRLEGGYVDTEVLRAKDGDWFMITSNGPGCGNGMQQLFVTTSNDGLSWSAPQAVTKADRRRLDPTGYEVSPNVFRIYYATSASPMDQNYTLARGTLKIGSGSGEVSIASPKLGGSCTKLGAKVKSGKVTLTCKKVKNKLVWSK